MNLGLIESELYDQFGFRGTPQTDVTTRFRRYVNETQKGILGTRGMSKLRRKVLPFASVANQATAALPQAASNVYTIVDRVNNWTLAAMTMEDIRAKNPGLAYSESYPTGYAIMDYSAPVTREPSDASELFVKSDSASDNSTKTAVVEGITSGGYYRSVEVALSGVTAVTLGSTISWIAITKFYLKLSASNSTTTAAGNVTLMEDSGSGTELSRIPIGRSYARYTVIHFHYVPTGVNTYYADIDRHIEDMANVADEPYLPEEYHHLLRIGAAQREYARRKDWAGYGAMKSEMKDGMDRLKLYVRRMSGIAQTRSPRDFSQLGPWFPAGS